MKIDKFKVEVMNKDLMKYIKLEVKPQNNAESKTDLISRSPYGSIDPMPKEANKCTIF